MKKSKPIHPALALAVIVIVVVVAVIIFVIAIRPTNKKQLSQQMKQKYLTKRGFPKAWTPPAGLRGSMRRRK